MIARGSLKTQEKISPFYHSALHVATCVCVCVRVRVRVCMRMYVRVW